MRHHRLPGAALALLALPLLAGLDPGARGAAPSPTAAGPRARPARALPPASVVTTRGVAAPVVEPFAAGAGRSPRPDADVPIPEYPGPLPQHARLESHALAPSGPVRLPAGAEPPPRPLAASPPPTASFAAMEDPNTSIPPDTHGAAGPAHLVVSINQGVRILTRAGVQLSVQTQFAFWSSTGAIGPFDPRVFYDAVAGRWIMTAVSRARHADSSILVAVSQTSDPTGAWNKYRIDADSADTVWADFPTLGWNGKWIVVQANMFTNAGAFVRTQIWAFDRAALEAGAPASFTLFSSSTIGGTQQPCIQLDPGLETLWLATDWDLDFDSDGDTAGESSVRLFAIQGAVGAETLNTDDTALVYAPLPMQGSSPGRVDLAPQLGTAAKIQCNDARMQCAVLRHGSIWVAQTAFLPETGTLTRSAAQWWQVTPFTSDPVEGGDLDATLAQVGRVDDPTGTLYRAFPSLAVNARGDVLMGYSEFSAGTFASAAYALRMSTDPPGTMRDSIVLKAGEDTYFKDFSSGRNRWGDYSFTSLDPVNDTAFWTIQEFARPDSGGFDRWGTWWGCVELCQADPSAPECGEAACANGLDDDGDTLTDRADDDCVRLDADGDGALDCADACPSDPSKTAPGVCGCGVSDADTDGDATRDCHETCDLDPAKTSPGTCGCGTPDTPANVADGDADGTINCLDGCPLDPLKLLPGACGCGVADTDGDGDTAADCVDACPADPLKVTAGACGCGTPDTDSDGDTTADCNDGCPGDAGKTSPGTCGCGTPDTDSDGDATADCNDGCPLDAAKTAPGLCGCGTPDTDSDGDGAPDCTDLCPGDPAKAAPGACGCGAPETDSDSDGAPDCTDECDADPLKQLAGACGCGVPETDGDGDATPDCNDLCPGDPAKTSPGSCGCGLPDAPDVEADGVPDACDNCPGQPNAAQDDADGDGAGDACDACPLDPRDDVDGDGSCGNVDNCPLLANAGQADADSDAAGDACDACTDSDGDGRGDPGFPANACPDDNCPLLPGAPQDDADADGLGDACDPCPADAANDADGDGRCADRDNCPAASNADQADADGDGRGDACDPCPGDAFDDADGDGRCANVDNCPSVANPGQGDLDGDGRGNACDACPSDPLKTAPGACGCGVLDLDSDGDGAPNCSDLCVNDPSKVSPGACGCGVADLDGDGDGRPDCIDACPADPLKVAGGACGCGVSDADSDGDGAPDCLDACPLDPAKSGPGSCGCGVTDADSDGDRVPDCQDGCPSNAQLTEPGACGCASDAGTADTDGDARLDCLDNCPTQPNPGQADSDGDGRGDACDTVACVPGDVSPDGTGDDALTPADFVLARRKVLGLAATVARDTVCGDVSPGAVTCAPAGAAASWCITGNATFDLADAVTIRRFALGVQQTSCAACAETAAPADLRLPGDVAPLSAPDGRVDVVDVVAALRMTVGLHEPTREQLLRVDVAPGAVAGGVRDVEGDGRASVNDVVALLRAATALETLRWSERTLEVRAPAPTPERVATFVAWEGWPAWAEPTAASGPGCATAELDAAGGRLALSCVSDPDAVSDALLGTLRYRAPEPLAPAWRAQLVAPDLREWSVQ